MRKARLLLFIALVFSFSTYAQFEKRVKPDIKAAIVFLKKAQITSEVRTEIESGTTKLVISGVPVDLNPNEIQVRGKGEGVIAGVAFRSKDIASKSKELAILEDSLEHLKIEYDSINSYNEILRNEEKMIYANEKLGGQNGYKTHELEDLADLYRERLPALRTTLYKNDLKKDKLNKKTDLLRKKIQNFGRSRGEIVITIVTESKGPIALEIDYLVNNAGWTPVYELKANNTKDPMRINFKAQVYQDTKIVWDNIKLTLSTGNPIAGVYKPFLGNWTLRFAPTLQGLASGVSVTRAKRASVEQKMDAPALESMALEEINEEKDIQTFDNFISNTTNSVVTEYEIKVPYTIPSDGISQSIDIKTLEIPASFKYLSVPKIENDVMLLASVTDWENLNLLPGSANIYFNDAYTGATYLDPKNLSDTLEIPLIRDKKVFVTREIIKEFSSKKFIGTTVKQELGYQITLRNANKEPINLRMIDQIPVSKDGQIEVEYNNESNALYNKDTGKLVWNLNLAPTETKKITFKFSVKYPKDKVVEGL